MKCPELGRSRWEASERLWERLADGVERKTLETMGKRETVKEINTEIWGSLKAYFLFS